MDRRKFLKTASGLFIPALPALIKPAEAGCIIGGGLLCPPPGGALGLQTNCTAFWEFQTTGWADATGNGTTLTGTGSPTTTTGVVGNAASLVASTSYLQAANNANINAGGGSFSAAFWVNLAGNPGNGFIFSKSLATFGNYEWNFGVVFTTANVFRFTCANTSTSFFTADDSVAFTTGSFVHLGGTFNSATGAMVIYKNGSQVGTGTLTGTLNSSASAPLSFGNNGAAISGVNSVVDQAGFWKGRILSAGDFTALYNSGNGLSWAAML